MAYQGYLGTYTNSNSEGLYRFTMDDEFHIEIQCFAAVDNPKYVTYVEDYIASIVEVDGKGGISLFDDQGTCYQTLLLEDSPATYIVYHNGFLYTANYHLGSVQIVKVNQRELSFVKKIEIKEKAGCHQVLFHNNHILVPCLLLDQVYVYDNFGNYVDTIAFPRGSGPRHGVVSFDQKYLYVVGELDNTLYVVDLDACRIVSSVNLLKDEPIYKGSAAIRLHGEYLYVSTRYKDVISILKVEEEKVILKDVISCFGKHPRDFIVMDDWLMVLNKDSDNLVVIDRHTYKKVSEASVPSGISIIAKEKSYE